uniref:Uncharacterized protein n=1 Tax=Oryza glumipatula TaxID=40148 RepID=A0A0D9ZNV7_9ORYZ
MSPATAAAGRARHSSSCCSLATSVTSRRHGTKTSVIGMIQIPSSSISMVVRWIPMKANEIVADKLVQQDMI